LNKKVENTVNDGRILLFDRYLLGFNVIFNDDSNYTAMKSIKVALVLLTFMFFSLCHLGAQPMHFNSLNVRDGLSQSGVLDVIQDQEGFMWFATRHGLNRYDGLRFKIYTQNANPSSISGDYINAITIDRKGRLWIGTNHGLDLYDKERDCFVHIRFSQNNSKDGRPDVLRLMEDDKANLWIGTDNGLYILNLSHLKNPIQPFSKFHRSAHLVGKDIWALYQDTKGAIWVSSEKGLSKINYLGNKLEFADKPSSLDNDLSTVRSIVEDDLGNIWFGTESKGLFCFNPLNNQLVNFQKESGNVNSLIHNSVRKVIRYGAHQLAVGTQGGLSLLNVNSKEFRNFEHVPQNKSTLSQNSVYSLYEDRQGLLWIGTYYGGVNIFNVGGTVFHDLLREYPALLARHQVIRAINSDPYGNLWIGSEGGGVSKLNTITHQVTHYHFASKSLEFNNFVKTIFIDSQRNVWIGTSGGGLKFIKRGTDVPLTYNLGLDSYKTKRSAIMAIYEGRNGLFWIGGLGYNRIYKMGGSEPIDVTPKKIETAFRNETIISIKESANQKIWILTEKRLYSYEPIRDHLEKILEDSTGFTCLLEDHSGIVWLGSPYDGLIGYNLSGKKIYRLNKENGLSNNSVVGLCEDKQRNLWISTRSGLNRLNTNRHGLRSFRDIEGIQSEEFNYSAIHILDGKMYLGSLDGLAYFEPEKLIENSTAGKMVFTGIRLANGILEEPRGKNKKNITFTAQQNIFTIEFSLLNFIRSTQNRYAYKLEGIGEDWTNVDDGQATFTNLPAGKYRLLVKGQNNAGVWSAVNSIDFEVLPPIWRTWWAYLCYALVLGSIVFMVIRYIYVQQLRQKEQELQQFKLNFFTNISHEIRSHLTMIMVPIENAILLARGNRNLADNLAMAKDNSTRLFRLVNELMDFRKAESKHLTLNKTNVSLAAYLEPIVRPFEQIAKDRGLLFYYNNLANDVVVGLDPFQFEKVLFNLLSNALKYTSPGEKITFELEQKANRLLVTVRNKGKGINPDHFEKIFENYFQIEKKDQETGYGIGLALSRHIVLLHHGEIGVKSKDGTTAFTVSIPCDQVGESTPDTNVSPHAVNPTPEIGLGLEEQLMDNRAKILIVEDNPSLLSLLCSLLKESYEVSTAEDGLEGLEKARSIIPDLVVSDIMMPKQNGVELCELLKKDELTSHIPVILLTAMTSEGDQITGLKSRADAYITKPYNREILLLQIRNLLESRYLSQLKYRQEFVVGPRHIVVNAVDEEFLTKFISTIETGLVTGQFDVEHLAEKMAMSQSALYRKVRALTGMTINEFSKKVRLKRAAFLLEQRAYTIWEIALMVGFMDSKYFAKEFKKEFGVLPSQYQG